MNTQRHIPALDGLRGCAVLMVIVFHFFQEAAGHAGSSILRASFIGSTGVDLFFVLSGFLITGILIRSKGGPHFIRNFYARRSLRILPLYFGFLLFSATLLPALTGDPRPSWMYWVFLQNVGMTFSDLASLSGTPVHLWSLAVEEHFYLFWPFLVLAFSGNRLVRVLVFLIAGALALRIALIASGIGVGMFTPVRMDTLAAGAVVAVFESENRLDALTRPVVRSLWVVVPALLAAFVLMSGSRNPVLQAVKTPLIAYVYTSCPHLCPVGRPVFPLLDIRAAAGHRKVLVCDVCHSHDLCYRSASPVFPSDTWSDCNTADDVCRSADHMGGS